MIYYNYPSFYHPPLNQYPNIQYSNFTRNKNFPNASIKHLHNDDFTQKNIQNRKNLNNANINNQKNNSQLVQKENSRKENQTHDETLFEILGIKLYFDDILLICLIFFLYTEGVQDQYLFIALILLLLS